MHFSTDEDGRLVPNAWPRCKSCGERVGIVSGGMTGAEIDADPQINVLCLTCALTAEAEQIAASASGERRESA